MNVTDDNTAPDGDAPESLDFTRALLAQLSAAVAAALALLDEARAEAEKAGPGAGPRLLLAYRERFRATMVAFTEALADVLEAAPAALSSASPDNPLTPLLEKSRDLPLFRRAQQSIANEGNEGLQRAILNGRGAGFDLPSLLLEDYYQETEFVRSFRGRVAAVGEMLRDEVTRRVSEGRNEVRVLTLHCGGLLEIEPLLENAVCAAAAAFTFVDASTPALRLARDNVAQRLALRPRFIRADPMTFGENLNRPRQPFDLVLTFSRFDLLSPREALGFARGCYTLLKPGGALITSGYLPDVPRREKALALGLLGARVNFWDERDWRNLLQRASRNCDLIRFERRPPAALALLAPLG